MAGDDDTVAKSIPVERRRRWVPATEIVGELLLPVMTRQALAEELRGMLDDTTDDLPW
ncbi:hypothetical protein [Sphaerimonospora thailandensis]|uniref:Uncharacterized protein n=1 Tax=Sphaerimonospora thailandensis TaxID=795644 RepID=A0A8J3RAK0_9ACTN|nr:hypothetical protein [Sphaerimonospora thailandensis]GIH69043.1 hypothetical protein Mth01_12960 [Sphaerimonospora thailandensis]